MDGAQHHRKPRERQDISRLEAENARMLKEIEQMRELIAGWVLCFIFGLGGCFKGWETGSCYLVLLVVLKNEMGCFKMSL